MEITLIIKGNSPADVREALRKLYEEGKPSEAENDFVPCIVEEAPRTIQRKRRTRHHYTKDQMKFILAEFEKGLSYANIATSFWKEYGIEITAAAVYRQIYNYLHSKA